MEAHLAPKEPIQVNKISSLCEICSGPHNTQYCMENLEEAFVDYASSRTDEAGGLVSNLMASQDARLSKFEANFKKQQSEMTNKIDTVLKAITDRILGALPSDTVKNPKLNVNPTTLVLYASFYTKWKPPTMRHIPIYPYCSIDMSSHYSANNQTRPSIWMINEETNRRGRSKGRDYGPTPNLLEEKHSESKDGVSSNNRRCLDLNEMASEKSR
ncbi:hypothetical protein Tco_0648744 [Tanacetum coccineum]